MMRDAGEASATEWRRTAAAQRAASPAHTSHRLFPRRPVSPPRFPQSPEPRAVPIDTWDAGSQDAPHWELPQLDSGADSGHADQIAGTRNRRARADREGPTTHGPNSASLPGATNPAAPADPTLSAHHRNEARRLSLQLTTEMRARAATNDVDGTWSSVFVPCVWLATRMHRQQTLLPTLEALGVSLPASQALGDHYDGLGLYAPVALATWTTSLPPTLRPRASGRDHSSPVASLRLHLCTHAGAYPRGDRPGPAHRYGTY